MSSYFPVRYFKQRYFKQGYYIGLTAEAAEFIHAPDPVRRRAVADASRLAAESVLSSGRGRIITAAGASPVIRPKV